MKQVQYYQIKTSRYRYHSPTKPEPELPNLICMTGKFKGSIVSIVSAFGPKFTVRLVEEPHTEFLAHYTTLELVNDDGTPMIVPVVDMTGRELTAGKFVVYSVPSGNSSHALEMGKIEEITKTGAVKVMRTIRNGQKVGGQNTWYDRTSRTLNDPDRTLMLPVEVSTLTSWVLQDFDGLKDQ